MRNNPLYFLFNSQSDLTSMRLQKGRHIEYIIRLFPSTNKYNILMINIKV